MKNIIDVQAKTFYSFILIIIFSWILSACQIKTPPNDLVTPSQDSANVLTLTPASLHTPFATPISTLSHSEKELLAIELYNTNGGCTFPCWWGITPGQTTWQTAKPFIEKVATTVSTSAESTFDVEFTVHIIIPVTLQFSEIESLVQDFYVKDGIIEIIQPETPHKMTSSSINTILDSYGMPSKVLIDTYRYSFGEIDPFRLVLFYPEKGILVRYFDDAEFQNNHVVGCFGGNQGAVVLFSPKANLSFARALNGTRGLGTFGEQYYKPLEEVTDIDLETFFETHLDPNTETCIETPIDLWQDR